MPWQGIAVETDQQPLGIVDGSIRFVWATDAHTNTAIPGANIRKAIDDCNTWRPQGLVLTGDISDNSGAGALACWYTVRTTQRPALWPIGNHDEEELTLGAGHPDTAVIAADNGWRQPAPFWRATHWESGDGTWRALVLVLDSNFYDDDPDAAPPGNCPNHVPGDRIGYSAGEPGGGYWHQLTVAQAAWVAQQLAADQASDAVLVFVHYPPVSITDPTRLADVLQADGRPCVGFCGHVHQDATSYLLTSTDTLWTATFYKCPAMQESLSWTRVTLGWDGSAITVDEMLVKNYTDPGGWTINAPFTV
jgi:hypothetical protein